MTDPDALDDKPSIEAVIQGTSAYPSGLVTDFGGRAVAEDEYARGPDCSEFLRSQRLTGVCFTFERAWHGLRRPESFPPNPQNSFPILPLQELARRSASSCAAKVAAC